MLVSSVVFNAAFAVVPLFLAPMSDYVGRNPVYLVSYLLFTLWFIGLALGQNIWSMSKRALLRSLRELPDTDRPSSIQSFSASSQDASGRPGTF